MRRRMVDRRLLLSIAAAIVALATGVLAVVISQPALGVIAGSCVRFDVDQTLGLKVPHMGWNQIEMRSPSPLFRDLPDRANVYFVHGYHVVPKDESVIATTTAYGRPFVSSICKDNILATQFHPEKSQKVGLKILANFAAM